MLLTIAPILPIGGGASRAVFVKTTTKELFMGFTKSTSDEPRVLLAEQLPGLDPIRLERYLELTKGESLLTVEARPIPQGDRWNYLLLNSNFLDSRGAPYIGTI
ncbi:MAG: hypothetical protein ACI88C_000062 [Acidimicrobiales bacterium]|jgi:hypothetical protein